MIGFYPIDGFHPADAALCSIESEGAFEAVFQRFAAVSGIAIDPYGDTRIMAPQLAVLAGVCRELALKSSGSTRARLNEVALIFQAEVQAGRGLIAIGD